LRISSTVLFSSQPQDPTVDLILPINNCIHTIIIIFQSHQVRSTQFNTSLLSCYDKDSATSNQFNDRPSAWRQPSVGMIIIIITLIPISLKMGLLQFAIHVLKAGLTSPATWKLDQLYKLLDRYHNVDMSPENNKIRKFINLLGSL
jgi:hypothetical protein